MVRVIATGVFDLIHPGHISYLEQAKALGDELIVIIACDKTVRSKKHEPITPEDMRARVVEALKPVDKTVIGKEGDIFETVKDINPDIIVLGFDQKFNEEKLKEDLKAHGLDHIRVVRANEYADDLNATRKIVAKIRGMQ